MLATQIKYSPKFINSVYFYLLVKIQASFSHAIDSRVKFVSQQMRLCIFRVQALLAHFLNLEEIF